MGYNIYNADGSLFYSSFSSGGAGGAGGAGGTGGTTPAAPSSSFALPFGHFWNANGVANSYMPFVITLLNQNTATYGIAPATYSAALAGQISQIGLYEAGPANGVHTVQILINGSVASTVNCGSGGNGAYLNAPTSISFNQNDKITAQVMNSVAGNSQIQMTLTMKLAG